MQAITDKDVQAVTESFNALIKELNRIADDINQSGADAIMIRDYANVEILKTSGMTLESFMQEVTNLSTRWNKGIFGKSKPVKRVEINHSNSSRTKASSPYGMKWNTGKTQQ